MNRKQLVALWIGIALFVGVGLYPPWVYTVQSVQGVASKNPASYAPLWAPPLHTAFSIPSLEDVFLGRDTEEGLRKAVQDEGDPFGPPSKRELRRRAEVSHKVAPSDARRGKGIEIDLTRLVLQLVMIALLTGGAVLTMADKKPKGGRE